MMFAIAFVAIDNKRGKWSCGNYLYNAFLIIAGYPILFAVYAFFSMFLGFSSGFWLAVTSTIMLLGAVGVFADSTN